MSLSGDANPKENNHQQEKTFMTIKNSENWSTSKVKMGVSFRRSRKMTKWLRLLFPPLLFATASWAAPMCTTATFATYDASGFSCTLGLLTFSGFQMSAVGSALPLLTDCTGESD
jgi:hypothetical protein